MEGTEDEQARQEGRRRCRPTESKFTDEFREMVLTHIPYTRLGTPDDLGRLASFLLCGNSDYTTGQVILVDGGFDTPGPLYNDLPKPDL